MVGVAGGYEHSLDHSSVDEKGYYLKLIDYLKHYSDSELISSLHLNSSDTLQSDAQLVDNALQIAINYLTDLDKQLHKANSISSPTCNKIVQQLAGRIEFCLQLFAYTNHTDGYNNIRIELIDNIFKIIDHDLLKPHQDIIYKALAESKYKLTDFQKTKFATLRAEHNQEQSIELLKLLIQHDLLNEVDVGLLKSSIEKNVKDNNPIYKDQLLLATKYLNEYLTPGSKLDNIAVTIEVLQHIILDYIKTSSEYEFIGKLLATSKDIILKQEVLIDLTNTIKSIANCIKIDQLLEDYVKYGGSNKIFLIQEKFDYLEQCPEIAITKTTADRLAMPLRLNNKVLPIQEVKANILRIEKYLTQVMPISGLHKQVGEEFYNAIAEYFTVCSEGEYFAASHIMTKQAINVRLIELGAVLISSNGATYPALVMALLKVMDNDYLTDEEFVISAVTKKSIYRILTKLVEKDVLTDNCYGMVLSIIKKYYDKGSFSSLVKSCEIIEFLLKKGFDDENVVYELTCEYLEQENITSKILSLIKLKASKHNDLVASEYLELLISYVLNKNNNQDLQLEILQILKANCLDNENILTSLSKYFLSTTEDKVVDDDIELLGIWFNTDAKQKLSLSVVGEKITIAKQILELFALYSMKHNKLSNNNIQFIKACFSADVLRSLVSKVLLPIVNNNKNLLSPELVNDVQTYIDVRNNKDQINIQFKSKKPATLIPSNDNSSKITTQTIHSVNKLTTQEHEIRNNLSIEDEVEQIINSLSYSKQFIQKIILAKFLPVAKDLKEFREFIDVLVIQKISEEEVITKYLGESDLSKIISALVKIEIDEHLARLDIEQELVEDFQKRYQELKRIGWQDSSFSKIIKIVNEYNISVTIQLLHRSYIYNLVDKDKDALGNSLVDNIIRAIDEGKLAFEINKEIFTVVNNKFIDPAENIQMELINKIIKLNPILEGKKDEYLQLINDLKIVYENPLVDDEEDNDKDSTIDNSSNAEINTEQVKEEVAIKLWDEDKVRAWAVKFKTSHSDYKTDLLSNKEELIKTIAVLQRANNLCTAKDGKDGHLYREAQVLSLLILLDESSSSEIKGKLLQIATGEGKSAISALLAAILVLHGAKVDIITSSSVLANAGYQHSAKFFDILGLSSSYNTGQRDVIGVKSCYDTEIVYGDTLYFETDYLSNISLEGARRGDRAFNIGIIDEVDSMLVDGINALAKQSNNVALMEYLIPIFIYSWQNMYEVYSQFKDSEDYVLSDELLEQCGKDIIDNYIGQLDIPKNFVAYARHMSSKWAKSLVGALTKYEENVDYVINYGDEGLRVINPINKATGVTQDKTIWQYGLHQFLQIKHNLRMSSEGLTTFFITNISYFKKYEHLYGMTGTLGSESSQEFLKETFNLELGFMPSFKDKQVISYQPQIRYTHEEWLRGVGEECILEASDNERSVLAVCRTIKEANELYNYLKRYEESKGIRVIDYTRSEEGLYNHEIEEELGIKKIIVATNLAGRGTDVRTSKELEANGGLHVILTFLGDSSRDDEQVKGRTARQGKKGTCQIFLEGEKELQSYINAVDFNDGDVIKLMQVLRDEGEKEVIAHKIKEDIPKLLAQDKLYEAFGRLYTELRSQPLPEQIKRARLSQLREDFGLWLEMCGKTGGSIDDFISSARDKFNSGDFTNVSYLLSISNGQVHRAIDEQVLYKAKGDSENGMYTFAADYYLAKKCIVKKPSKNKGEYKQEAAEHLANGLNKLSELIGYWRSVEISVIKIGSNQGTAGGSNELAAQIARKIASYEHCLEVMQQGYNTVLNSGEKYDLKTVSNYFWKDELRLDDAGKKNWNSKTKPLDIGEQEEIGFLGINDLYQIDEYKKPKDRSIKIIMGICSIVQVVVGTALAVCSGGALGQFGISMIVSGLKDGVDLARGQVPHDLKQYFNGKLIEYAVKLAEIGISKGMEAIKNANATNAGKNMVEKAVPEHIKEAALNDAAKVTVMDIVKEVAIDAGTQLATIVATEQLAKMVAKKFEKVGGLDNADEKVRQRMHDETYRIIGNGNILSSKEGEPEAIALQRELGREFAKVLKEPRYVSVMNQIRKSVMRNALQAGGGNLGNTLMTGVTIAETAVEAIDGWQQISPIMDEWCAMIQNKVQEKMACAQNRISSNKIKVQLDERYHEQMASSIGNMCSNMMHAFLQGRVVMPVVEMGVSKVVDMAVGNVIAKQKEQLARLKETREYQQEKEKAGIKLKLEEAVNTAGKTQYGSSVTTDDDYVESRPHVHKGGGKAVNKNRDLGSKVSARTTNNSKVHNLIKQQQAQSQQVSNAEIGAQLTSQILGTEPTEAELHLLALTHQKPVVVMKDGKMESSYGMQYAGKPIVVRSANNNNGSNSGGGGNNPLGSTNNIGSVFATTQGVGINSNQGSDTDWFKKASTTNSAMPETAVQVAGSSDFNNMYRSELGNTQLLASALGGEAGINANTSNNNVNRFIHAVSRVGDRLKSDAIETVKDFASTGEYVNNFGNSVAGLLDESKQIAKDRYEIYEQDFSKGNAQTYTIEEFEKDSEGELSIKDAMAITGAAGTIANTAVGVVGNAIGKVPVVGSALRTFGRGVQLVKDGVLGVAEMLLPEETTNNLKDTTNNMPRSVNSLFELGADLAIAGAMVKTGSSGVAKVKQLGSKLTTVAEESNLVKQLPPPAMPEPTTNNITKFSSDVTYKPTLGSGISENLATKITTSGKLGDVGVSDAVKQTAGATQNIYTSSATFKLGKVIGEDGVSVAKTNLSKPPAHKITTCRAKIAYEDVKIDVGSTTAKPSTVNSAITKESTLSGANKVNDLAKKFEPQKLEAGAGAEHPISEIPHHKFTNFSTKEVAYLEIKIEEALGEVYPGSIKEAAAVDLKIMSYALAEEMVTGKREIIAGGNSGTILRDANRLVAQYGGSAIDWVKIRGTSLKLENLNIPQDSLKFPPKTRLELHWYENIKTGQKVEVKPKIQVKAS